jgi:2-dehydro-3-deoxyphosphogluconate aldolase/(4S)-4-hydroxy-2-oxoglutarate aldolase
MSAIRDILSRAPVMAILEIDDAALAAPLAQALVQNGLPVIEVTLRTPAALAAIAAMAAIDGAIIGAGTVLSANQLHDAFAAGARFGVSPGLTDRLAQAVADAAAPFLPGVATAAEIQRAREWGFDTLKFYPAESLGGPAALKAFAGPFADIRFSPSGGLTASNAPGYLALANVIAVGGSWIAPRAEIAAQNWALIGAHARAARKLR